MSARSASAFPTLVSFCAGGPYYHDMADRLRRDCEALDMPSDIRAIPTDGNEDWAALCRRKIPFYEEMLARHENGIFWADVDTKLVRRPELLANASYDVAAFLRMFRGFREYDPVQYARTFHPGFLHLNNTPKTRRFVAHMAALERASPLRATDDYFLEEAWRSFEEPLAVLLLPPDILARAPEEMSEATCFLFGESGNVQHFRGGVEQHTSALHDRRRQTKLLKQYGKEALDEGQRDTAMVFFRKAHAIDPTDGAAAASLARTALQLGQPELASAVVMTSFGPAVSHAGARRILVDAALQLGHWPRARDHLAALQALSDPKSDGFLRSRAMLIGLEERAAALGLAPEDRPALQWQDSPHPGNFGETVGAYLVEKLSGLPPRRASGKDALLASASGARLAKAGTPVWGAGMLRKGEKLSPAARYHAVRGPLTRAAAMAAGATVPDLLGSPALLLPLIHRPVVAKTHRLGLIRHYNHQAEPLRLDGVREISILRAGPAEIEAFIEEVNACEAIASTALHGLIVAQAYGIPTRWCTFSRAAKAVPGDMTKFEDHYLALGIPFSPPSDLSGLETLTADFASLCVERPARAIPAEALLRAAPFPVLARFLQPHATPSAA